MEREQDTSAELFALLANENLDDAGKQKINKLVEDNPGILSGKDFTKHFALPDLLEEYNKGGSLMDITEKADVALRRTHRVLENLHRLKKEGFFPSIENPTQLVAGKAWQPNGETIATQAIKNFAFLKAATKETNLSAQDRALVADRRNRYSGFLKKLYVGDDSYGCDNSDPNARGQKPDDLVKQILNDRKTLTIDDLKTRAYLGTLTVEQADQLRKHEDQKKVADMKNIPGDRKREKHESNDKFRDEDVVKYMYEDWFLGGMSSVFNKIEDIIMNTVDDAGNKCVERARDYRATKDAQKDRKLTEALGKVNTFTGKTSESIRGLGAECTAKIASFRDILKDLRDNLNNPNPKWKYYQPDDPFIQQLQANPAQAEKFLDSTEQSLENRLKMIETTGKLAMQITSTEMSCKFMKENEVWRKGGKKDGEYLSDEEIYSQFILNSRQKQKKILDAISVISEDTRLLAEARYDHLPPAGPGEVRPSMQEYIQEQVSKEINSFLKDLATSSADAISAQQETLAKGKDAFSDKTIGKIAKKIDGINKTIDKKIRNGAVYDNQIFKEEHSKERIQIQTGLYEEAVAETSPASMQNLFTKLKELNTYNQQTLQARRDHAEERKKQLEIFRTRLERRDSMFPRFNLNQRE